jgi:hypothetical protein
MARYAIDNFDINGQLRRDIDGQLDKNTACRLSTYLGLSAKERDIFKDTTQLYEFLIRKGLIKRGDVHELIEKIRADIDLKSLVDILKAYQSFSEECTLYLKGKFPKKKESYEGIEIFSFSPYDSQNNINFIDFVKLAHDYGWSTTEEDIDNLYYYLGRAFPLEKFEAFMKRFGPETHNVSQKVIIHD